MFNEGYAASSGNQWIRPLLCQEALRIGRVLAEIAPTEAEVHGLVALMEFQSSRFKSRVNAQGEPVLLMDQNRALWDYLLIRRGFAALERIERLGNDRALRYSGSHLRMPCRSAECRRDRLDSDLCAV